MRFALHSKKAILTLLATVLFFILLAAVLFSRAVFMPVSHDEYQFVASAHFFKENLLLPYLHYPFLHMPYIPVVGSLALLFTRYELFAIRLLNSVFTLSSMLLLFDLVFRQGSLAKTWQRALFGVTAVLLFIANPSFIEIDGRALNHALPIFLSIATFWLWIRASHPQHSSRVSFICGLLAGLAAGVRLSYLVLLFPLLFAILFDPLLASPKQRLRGGVALSLGFILALLPASVLFLIAPRPFIYGNVHYNVLNAIYRQNLGSSDSITFLNKSAMLLEYVTGDPANSLLYLIAFAIFCAAFIHWIKTRDRAVFQIILLFVYSLVLLAAGFAPTPSWPQYFIALTPFLILSLFWGLALLLEGRPVIAWAIIACLGLAFTANRPLQEIPAQLARLPRQEQWVPLQLHRFAGEIRAGAGCQDANCTLLTLAPLYPIEAALSSYPMFTVGSFSWRTAPILPAQTRAAYHIVSYEELDAFLAPDPPDAILTGTEANYDGFTTEDPGGLDQPFVDYATRNHYRPIPVSGVMNNQTIQLTIWVK